VGFLSFSKNWADFLKIVRTIFWVLPKKSGLLAIFKMKVGTLKPSVHAGLRAFCPLAHFFSYLIVIKSLIYIYN